MDASTDRDAGGRDGGVDAEIRDGGSSDAGLDAAELDAGPYEPPDPVEVPTLPAVPELSSALPRDAEGRPILGEAADVRLVVEAPPSRGPVDALAACAALVSYCVSPERSLDACMASAPRCATEQPWDEPACCPSACQDGYEAQRRAGAMPIQAFRRVLFRDARCIPGLAERLGGTP